MYAHCVWCTGSLGRNETIEAFPVGRRLAFDQAKGRLWVVCPSCTRWNLTPLEERWDAIEACERLYRDTRKRVSTDQIGLAQVGDGVDLVRIGAPLLPEFAAWRYGGTFRRRRRRALVIGAGLGVALATGPLAVKAVVGSTWVAMQASAALWHHWKKRRLAAHFPLPDGEVVPLSSFGVSQVRAVHAEGRWRFAAPPMKPGGQGYSAIFSPFFFRDFDAHARGERTVLQRSAQEWQVLEGVAARRALSAVLPAVNAAGGSRAAVRDGVRLIESAPADDLAATLMAGRRLEPEMPLQRTFAALRLAIEMALHDADERRWLEGELADLEARWRDAEALAAIADRLPESPPGAPER